MLSKGLQGAFGKASQQGIRAAWTQGSSPSKTNNWLRLERMSPSLRSQCRPPMVGHTESARSFASAKNVNPQTEHQEQQQDQHQQQDPRAGSGFCSNGFCWLILGWSGLVLTALDQLLQYKQKQERQRILNELQQESDERNPPPSAWSENSSTAMATKYQCKVITVSQTLDGTHVLRDATVGEVVDVLQESVGPNADYHLCRRSSGNRNNASGLAIGWYPVKYLEKV
jgi:hypothetical protein